MSANPVIRLHGPQQDTLAAPTVEQLASGGEPLLLRPAEAAKLLATSPRTLWGLTQRGEIRSIKINRAVRYPRSELLAFIAAKQQA